MNLSIQLQGFAELATALKELPDNIGKNVLRAAVGAGAAEIRKEVRMRAPILTGRLRRAVYSKQIRELSSLSRQVFYVGVRQGVRVKNGQKDRSQDAFYGRFVEFGHFARVGSRGALTRGKVIEHLKAGTARWIPAQPFMRPSFDSRKGAAIDAMARKLKERLERFRVQGR